MLYLLYICELPDMYFISFIGVHNLPVGESQQYILARKLQTLF
jgi:hypothetical protein